MSIKNLQKLFIISCCAVLMSGCGKKQKQPIAPPTPTPRLIEIKLDKRPYISLIPRSDGHELKLKIDKISSDIKTIEYELIYTATDQNLEIEKGLSGAVDIDSYSIDKDLLLGTSSCTGTCKYKYDEGITGGSLNLIFTTQANQIAMFETPFKLSDTAQVKKEGLTLSDFSLEATPNRNEFYILMQNYNQGYSIFSSGNGTGTIQSISSGFTRLDENKIATDYHYTNE